MLFISPDRPEKLAESSQKGKFEYTLLSDSSAAAARAFGLAWQLNADQVARLNKFGIDIEADSGEKHHILPVPAVFIFDTKGTVRFSYVDPRYQERIAPDLLLAAARASKD